MGSAGLSKRRLATWTGLDSFVPSVSESEDVGPGSRRTALVSDSVVTCSEVVLVCACSQQVSLLVRPAIVCIFLTCVTYDCVYFHIAKIGRSAAAAV